MKRTILTFFLFITYVGVSFGQVADGLSPLERKQLTVLSEPPTLYKGFLRAGYNFKYSRPGRTFDRNGTVRAPEDFNFTGNYLNQLISLSYGISDRVQVSVALPYVRSDLKTLVRINEPGNELAEVRVDIGNKGAGDLETEMRVQVLKETDKIPSLVAGIGVHFPTGSNIRTISTDQITGDVRYKDVTGGVGSSVIATIQLRKIIYPYLFAAEFNYFFGSDGEIIENNQVNEVIGANSAIWTVTTGMHLNEWITVTGKLFYQRLSFDSQVEQNETVPLIDNSKKDLLTFDPTLTFQFGRIRAQQVIAIPLAGRSFTAELEYAATIQYTF